LPEGFGNWKTIYNWHRRWSLDGSWEQILDGLRAGCDEAEGKDWTVSADSTVNRAHQHAAGARRVPAAEWTRSASGGAARAGHGGGPAARWPARPTAAPPTAPPLDSLAGPRAVEPFDRVGRLAAMVLGTSLASVTVAGWPSSAGRRCLGAPEMADRRSPLTLQESLLPPRLPEIPGLHVAAR
jgi:hypothetical protein